MNTKLTLGFSPCPNDTFIFEKLLSVNFTDEFTFEPVIADVEELNRKAFAEELDITKLSFHTWLHLQDKYDLLNSGSALGRGCGPMLIAKKEISLHEIDNCSIAIPGKFTTANFLLSARFPNLKNKKEMIFSSIEDAVINGDVDAGLIIHENRFTYQQKGLIKIMDMGEWWETHTQCAIPLGGIVIHKRLGNPTKNKIDALLKQSVEWAMSHKPFISDFVKHHSQTMQEDVMRQHIDLYVNEFTIDLGDEGKKAIDTMKYFFNNPT
jgi:1,4-dihydroxy-6-naphthoate synthase